MYMLNQDGDILLFMDKVVGLMVSDHLIDGKWVIGADTVNGESNPILGRYDTREEAQNILDNLVETLMKGEENLKLIKLP